MAINVYTINELLRQEFPATDSMLDNGLIDKQGAILISGPQKIGKSLFGTQLALSLASQRPFLGFNTGHADYRTLVLQAEVAERRMQDRFIKQITGFPEQAGGRVLSASVFSSIKLDTAEGLAAVHAWVDEYRPDLLVIDPLSNFHSGDENTARDILKVTNALDSIRAKGAAVAVIHHHAKGSAVRTNVGHKARGSSALPGWYDSHFSLEWADYPRTVRLEFELRHDETPEDVILQLNRDTLQFEVQTDEAAQIGLVVSVVRDGRAPVPAEAVGTACRKTRQWASEWLNRAVDEGRLVRSGTRPVLFSLPETQPTGTRVEVPQPGGAPAIVVTTNTVLGTLAEPEGVEWWTN